MTGSILYCGDTDLNGAASYLAGMMSAWDWPFDYVPSHQRLTASLLEIPRSLIILSDFPASHFDPECQQRALTMVEQGCGLLMIGGWESFHGYGGDWNGTVLGSALPVEILGRDDRVNFDQSAWILPQREHPVTSGLPWCDRPPAIGGMNRVIARLAATVVLTAQSFCVVAPDRNREESLWSFERAEELPLLVVGEAGAGRTAAFLSDVAPHWVGGFVDWGLPRFQGQAANGQAIEVGHYYARFWKQLLQWTGQRPVEGQDTEVPARPSVAG